MKVPTTSHPTAFFLCATSKLIKAKSNQKVFAESRNPKQVATCQMYTNYTTDDWFCAYIAINLYLATHCTN